MADTDRAVDVADHRWFIHEGIWCFQGENGPLPAAIETGTIIPALLDALVEARTLGEAADG